MSRAPVVDAAAARAEAKPLPDAVVSRVGAVPDRVRSVAEAAASLESSLGLHAVAGKGAPDERTREQLAATVAGVRSCHHCMPAHTVNGLQAGLAA